MPELRPLSKEAVEAALDKAVRYRLLNEPAQAESICRDILRVDPEHQEALKTLILALSEQFRQRLTAAFTEAQEVVPRLTDEYARIYYRGIVFERRAYAHMRRAAHGSGRVAHDWFQRALECYERAIELRREGNDEAILRWNSCVRTVDRHRELQAAPEDDFQPMLE